MAGEGGDGVDAGGVAVDVDVTGVVGDGVMAGGGWAGGARRGRDDPGEGEREQRGQRRPAREVTHLWSFRGWGEVTRRRVLLRVPPSSVEVCSVEHTAAPRSTPDRGC